MPSLRSGKTTSTKTVIKRRVAPTVSSRSQPNRKLNIATSSRVTNNRSLISHPEIAEAIDKPNNINEATSNETDTCSTGLNVESEIAQNIQADGEGGTDKSLVDNQEASEIANQSAEQVEIGDRFNLSEAAPGVLDLSEANKHAATTLPEGSEGSEVPTIPNTPTAEYTPITVNANESMVPNESISDAANELQIRISDFTRAFDNTTGVPTQSQRERTNLDAAMTERTPLDLKLLTSERGKKRKGSDAGPDIGEVQAGISQDSPIDLTDDAEDVINSVSAKRRCSTRKRVKKQFIKYTSCENLWIGNTLEDFTLLIKDNEIAQEASEKQKKQLEIAVDALKEPVQISVALDALKELKELNGEIVCALENQKSRLSKREDYLSNLVRKDDMMTRQIERL